MMLYGREKSYEHGSDCEYVMVCARLSGRYERFSFVSLQ